MKDSDCDPSQKAYVTVLAILVEENQLNLGFKSYKNMREIGLPPSVASLNVLIKSLCRNEGTVDAGLKIFLETPKRECGPDSYTYGALISGLIAGLCKEQKIQEAVELLDRMNLQGLKPDAGLYGKVISGFCAVSKFRKAANFFGQVIQVDRAFTLYLSMRSIGISVEVETLDALVKCLCKKGEFQKAFHLVNELATDGCIP